MASISCILSFKESRIYILFFSMEMLATRSAPLKGASRR
jgi:hypothetical protein